MLAVADRSRANAQTAAQYETAIRQYNKVLACDPSNPKAQQGLEKAMAAKLH
jgi:hypothetical protein